jgi:hypothetical protein
LPSRTRFNCRRRQLQAKLNLMAHVVLGIEPVVEVIYCNRHATRNVVICLQTSGEPRSLPRPSVTEPGLWCKWMRS